MSREQSLLNDLLPHTLDVRIEADRAYFAVLSDIHQGLNDRKLLKYIVEFLLKIPNCKVIIGGDATNTNTRHSKGVVVEEWASGDEQILTLAEDLKPLLNSGQLVGIVSGNHPFRAFQETFINPEMMLASILGDRKLYKGAMAIVYFNVNKNCYIHTIMHKGVMKVGAYDYLCADVNWLEHYHKPEVLAKVVIEHNKYTKKPIVKRCFEVHNGSFQTYPDYAKRAGYRPYLPGFFIAEMGGLHNKRELNIWWDADLATMIERGYTV